MKQKTEQSPAKRFPYHPYVLAAAPPLMLYASHFRETPMLDVVVPLLAVLAVTVVVVAGFRLLFSTWERASIASSFVLVLTLFFSSANAVVEGLLSNWIRYIRYRYSLGTWLAVLLLGLLWLRLARFNDRKVTPVLNLLSVMAIVSPALMVAISLLTGPSYSGPDESTLRALEDNEIVLQRPEPARDIYYLVFDRYTNNRVMKDEFGYDNSSFYHRLRQRGFHCLVDGWTNYPRTVISMASALNMTYHGKVIENDASYGRRIKNHRVGRLLTALGYKYYHIGNFYNPLRFNENADFNYRVSPMPSEFADAVYYMTPMSRVWPSFWPPFLSSWFGVGWETRPDSLTSQMDVLEKIVTAQAPEFAAEGPKFVYAHFLPHHTKICGDNYTTRTTFVNDSIIEMVDQILESSKTPPIIAIQADEGPYLTEQDANKDPLARIRKRAGIISAFYLPGVDAAAKLPHTLTPVNTFRLVFKEYFGADLELLKDRTFYWEHESTQQAGTPGPGRFIDVTEQVRGTP